MAANLRDPGSIPGGDPKRFQDSSNYVFHIVGECFSSAADTHLATDLTCKVAIITVHFLDVTSKHDFSLCAFDLFWLNCANLVIRVSERKGHIFSN